MFPRRNIWRNDYKHKINNEKTNSSNNISSHDHQYHIQKVNNIHKTIILSGQKRTDERLAGQSHCAKFTVVIDTNVDLIELRGEEKKQKKTQKEKKKKKKKKQRQKKSKSKELVKKHAILRALKKKQNKAKQNQTKGNEENRKQKGKRAEI